MAEVGVHRATPTLPELLRRVAEGEEITITRGGRPVAMPVPASRRTPRHFGADEGRFEVPEGFDDPLPGTADRHGLAGHPDRARECYMGAVRS